MVPSLNAQQILKCEVQRIFTTPEVTTRRIQCSVARLPARAGELKPGRELALPVPRSPLVITVLPGEIKVARVIPAANRHARISPTPPDVERIRWMSTQA